MQKYKHSDTNLPKVLLRIIERYGSIFQQVFKIGSRQNCNSMFIVCMLLCKVKLLVNFRSNKPSSDVKFSIIIFYVFGSLAKLLVWCDVAHLLLVYCHGFDGAMQDNPCSVVILYIGKIVKTFGWKFYVCRSLVKRWCDAMLFFSYWCTVMVLMTQSIHTSLVYCTSGK